MKSLLLLLLYANICESSPAGTRTFPFAGTNGQNETSSTNVETPIRNYPVKTSLISQVITPNTGVRLLGQTPVQNPSAISIQGIGNNGYQGGLSNVYGSQSTPHQQTIYVDPNTGQLKIRTVTVEKMVTAVVPGYKVTDLFGNVLAETPTRYVNLGNTNANSGTATMPANPSNVVNVIPVNPNGGIATMPANPPNVLNVIPVNPNGGIATVPANPPNSVSLIPLSSNVASSLQPGMNPISTNPSGGIPQRCVAPTYKPGPQCMASFVRYTYNPVTQKCEEFIYGGCNPSLNNFETLEECNATCMVR
ncbi:Kunitz/Bovine pancreatic trypsin inhibitor domain protein [Ancylostoma caninum]|uniref:Kunitz/Bovine pancreatic trypsin inhibitor domain protein n=1 Tax=Ancylostoma caninum TaxID=29170 RepID=A0A368FY14_ANCCA|nr:Kunitz/Bovine pancreatic trypsin inhibitor domain protein [Ancylostoma caninum]